VGRSKSLALCVVMVWALAGLILTGFASAARTSKVVAHGGLVKGHLIAIAQGIAISPKTISFVITSKPAQMVKVDWSVVCDRRLATPTVGDSGQVVASESQEKGGVFSATTPVSRPLPLTIKHPTACIVNVYGTLSEHGTELVKILQN